MHFSQGLLVCCLVLWPAGLLVLSGAPASNSRDVPSVDAILSKAVARAEWTEEEKLERQFDFFLRSTSEKLRPDGTVSETEESLYQVQMIEGHPFSRLIQKDGRPLTEEEEKKQQRKLEDFRRDLVRGKTPDESAEERVRFNQDLVSRFDFSLDGIESLRGRDSYRLSFQPASRDLPVRSRIDRALNESVGSIWIDCDSFEVSRVEFSLIRPVKVWWGLIGNIASMRGRIDRAPVEPEVWLPTQMQFHLNGRILFMSLNQRQQLVWSDFKRVDPATLSFAR